MKFMNKYDRRPRAKQLHAFLKAGKFRLVTNFNVYRYEEEGCCVLQIDILNKHACCFYASVADEFYVRNIISNISLTVFPARA